MAIDRPANPYYDRMNATAAGEEMLAGLAPPRDPGAGPGLLGADLDRIARYHYRRGLDEGEMKAAQIEASKLEAQARAFEEGVNAGNDAVLRAFAGSIRRRLLADLHFPIVSVASGPKAKARDALVEGGSVAVRLRELLAWVEAVERGEEPGL